jgi:hypothetical protein
MRDRFESGFGFAIVESGETEFGSKIAFRKSMAVGSESFASAGREAESPG